MSGPASPWVLRAHPWSLPLFYLCSLRGAFPCFPLLWACTRHDASVATGSLPAIVTGHGAAVCCLPTTSTPAARGGSEVVLVTVRARSLRPSLWLCKCTR